MSGFRKQVEKSSELCRESSPASGAGARPRRDGGAVFGDAPVEARLAARRLPQVGLSGERDVSGELEIANLLYTRGKQAIPAELAYTH